MLYSIARNILKAFLKLFFRVDYKGIENISYATKLIVCSNHKSVFDPIFIAVPIKKRIRYMAKSELFEDHGAIVRWLLYQLGAFPVKRNKTGIQAIKKSISILNNSELLGIFPQGKCVFENAPFEPKAGIAHIAAKCEASVLPICIYSEEKIKLFSHVTVRIGKVIKYNELFPQNINSNEIQDASTLIANRINELLEEKY